MKIKTELNKYSNGVWALGISISHIPKEVYLYIKLFKWYLSICFMKEVQT